eukprot:scaffold31706_cov14-Tisochrysis_lutea.AAC.1
MNCTSGFTIPWPTPIHAWLRSLIVKHPGGPSPSWRFLGAAHDLKESSVFLGWGSLLGPLEGRHPYRGWCFGICVPWHQDARVGISTPDVLQGPAFKLHSLGCLDLHTPFLITVGKLDL